MEQTFLFLTRIEGQRAAIGGEELKREYFFEGDREVTRLVSKAGTGDVSALLELSCLYYNGKILPPAGKSPEVWKDACREVACTWAQEAVACMKEEKRQRQQSSQWKPQEDEHPAVEATGERKGTLSQQLIASRYRRAAEKGNSTAQFNLAECYLYGNGVEQSKENAMFWYKIAADNGSWEAEAMLKSLNKKQNPSAQWNPQQDEHHVLEDSGERSGMLSQQLVASWYRRAAEKGNSTAQFNLAECYLYGNGVEQSKEKAMFWYKMAADNGSWEAEAMLKSLNKKGNSWM